VTTAPRPPAEPSARPKKKKLSKRILFWMALNIAPPIVHTWMTLFDKTARRTGERDLILINSDWLVNRLRKREGNVILCVWHNRLMFGPTAYNYCDGQRAVVMVSRSLDGEIIIAVLNRFKKISAVRGSSKSKPGQDKGGTEALNEMIELGKQGVDLVITPDGPQGPRYKAKRGIIALAKVTGLPIVPVAPNCKPYFQLKSWDQTRFPRPYSKFVYQVGDPIYVPADADEEMIEQKRQELERVMMEMTEHVDNFFIKGEWEKIKGNG
jgi:lysophospholipid acyltransferase (LPLAT)-like uncharacterized protein